jgi:hypothetical protein
MKRAPAFALSCLLAAGCVHRPALRPPPEPLTAGQVLARVKAADSAVLGVRGEARLKARTPQGRGAVTLYVAAQRPGLLRLESLDFFGRPQAVLVSDGQRFGLHQVSEGRFYRGPASPENLSRFLPVVLPAEELLGLLLGEAPVLAGAHPQVRWDADPAAWALELRAGGVVQRLQVDAGNFRVRESRVEGMPAYDLRFSDVREVGGAFLPHVLVLEAQAAQTELELVYKDPEVNAPVDLGLFDLAPPLDVPVVEVDAQGRDSGGKPP